MMMSKDLPPTKTGLKLCSKGLVGPTSQIPGLSPDAANGPEDSKPRGRRSGVLETDSDYVKLAKRGGQKNLLWHEEVLVPKPVAAYAPRNLLSTPSEDRSDSSLTENGDKKKSLLEPPFWIDDDSALQKGDHRNSENKSEAPVIQTSALPSPTTSSFKKLSLNKNPTPVNMSKLLSFGYADDQAESRRDVSSSKE